MWSAQTMGYFYFYPRPPRGGRPDPAVDSESGARFLSTPSARRATHVHPVPKNRIKQFLSTPSARRATCAPAGYQFKLPDFYPRPPRGGRHPAAFVLPGCDRDFYPRPPRGGRRRCGVPRRWGISISIHALREEGDGHPGAICRRGYDFYPRPPRGGRPVTRFWPFAVRVFLSTPSARRATRIHPVHGCSGGNFYPRPPRGGRRHPQTPLLVFLRFLSTPSARRATRS